MLSDERLMEIEEQHHGSWRSSCKNDGGTDWNHECDPAWQHVQPCLHPEFGHQDGEWDCRNMQCEAIFAAMYSAVPDLLAEIERLYGVIGELSNEPLRRRES